MQHFDRQRTKVVQRAERYFASLEHFLNAGHERNPDAVAELDPIETKLDLDFAKHFIAGGMPAGVPRGREREHQIVAAAEGVGVVSSAFVIPG